MTTVKQLQRLWDDRKYPQLFAQLAQDRADDVGLIQPDPQQRWVPAAALTLIRLDELGQVHVPLYSRLVRSCRRAAGRRWLG